MPVPIPAAVSFSRMANRGIEPRLPGHTDDEALGRVSLEFEGQDDPAVAVPQSLAMQKEAFA